MSSASRKVARRQKRPSHKTRVTMRSTFRRPWREVESTIRAKKAVERLAKERPFRVWVILWMNRIRRLLERIGGADK